MAASGIDPSPDGEDLPLLWHIPFSHFNEKVRWALDFKGIPHRRRCLGPDYLIKAWRATGHGTLPILFLDGAPVGDSTAIIAALEERQPEPALYPRIRRNVGARSSWRTTSTRCWARACARRWSHRSSATIPTWPCAC
jgi:glutathione S-transferase